MARKVNLGVLISGGGTTLQNFIDKIAEGTLNAEIKVVISSLSKAYGLVRAKNHGIPTAVVRKKDFPNWEEMSRAITAELDKYPIDLICMAGFMCFYVIPERYKGRVMNIHPALIPAFCGERLYGHLVHEAVLEYGAKVSGCTVHFADNQYDHGPIIVQKTVPVMDDDTPDTLAKRVFEKECEAYPEAINLFAEGRLKIEGRRTKLINKRAR